VCAIIPVDHQEASRRYPLTQRRRRRRPASTELAIFWPVEELTTDAWPYRTLDRMEKAGLQAERTMAQIRRQKADM